MPTSPPPAPPPTRGSSAHTLAAWVDGRGARIVRVEGAAVEGPVTAWLAAVGLSPGEVVTILRRAPFGGPLHLRTEAGAEIAVALEIAQAILVETLEDQP